MGLDTEYLWTISQREYDALKEQWESSHHELHVMYAEIQATIHNAWLRGKDERQWIAQDFMGGRPPQTPEEKAAVFASLLEARKLDRASVGLEYSEGQPIVRPDLPQAVQLSREDALARVEQWRRSRLDAEGVPLSNGKGKVTLDA